MDQPFEVVVESKLLSAGKSVEVKLTVISLLTEECHDIVITFKPPWQLVADKLKRVGRGQLSPGERWVIPLQVESLPTAQGALTLPLELRWLEGNQVGPMKARLDFVVSPLEPEPKIDPKSSETLQRSEVTNQPTAFTQPASSVPLAIPLPDSSAPNTQPDSILIVTVTKVEAQAVLDTFSQAAGQKWTRQMIGKKTYYVLGIHGGAPVFMVQSEMGIATPGGAMLTVRQAIQDLRPQAVIMCGIAFGLRSDKQRLGDILVSQQLLYYGPQKVDFQRGQTPRGDRTTSAERLLDRFRSGDNDWQGARTHFGLVLSGETLVNDPAFRDWLLNNEPEAIGGEMEGAGLYAAARDAKMDWILVKAICDWADGKKNDEAQSLAACNAAQFILHVLQLGGWGRQG